jgi:hypothetical protein
VRKELDRHFCLRAAARSVSVVSPKSLYKSNRRFFVYHPKLTNVWGPVRSE